MKMFAHIARRFYSHSTSAQMSSLAEPIHKAIIIGVDGCRSDAITAASSPNMHRFRPDGGNVWSQTTRITLSSPAWTSCLTGRWPNKHGVLHNQGWASYDGRTSPTVFKRLGRIPEPIDGSSVVSWGALAEPLLSDCRSVKVFEQRDDQVTGEVENQIAHHPARLIYTHLGGADEEGHRSGFGPDVPEYSAAVKLTDGYVGRIRQAVARRVEKHPEERWLAILVTDHGGGVRWRNGHGDDSPLVRRNFVWANYVIDADGNAARKVAGEQIIDVPRFVYCWMGVDCLRLLSDRGEDPDEDVYKEFFKEYEKEQDARDA